MRTKVAGQGRRTQTDNQERNQYQTEVIAPDRDKSQAVSQMRDNKSGREKRRPASTGQENRRDSARAEPKVRIEVKAPAETKGMRRDEGCDVRQWHDQPEKTVHPETQT